MNVYTYTPAPFYLMTWSSPAQSPNGTRKRSSKRSDSIRPMGFGQDLA